MAEETNEGVAYLRALRQSVGPSAKTAAETAREPGPEERSDSKDASTDSGERFQGAEKRRSPRYKCEGSVELREDNCDVRTWASFRDVSLHGCYVEAQATYPVGTPLRVKLANGFRVETKGNVRVNYPYLGMGIAFVDMSEENRDAIERTSEQHLPSNRGHGTASGLIAATRRCVGCRTADLRSLRGGAGAHRVLRKPPGVNARRVP